MVWSFWKAFRQKMSGIKWFIPFDLVILPLGIFIKKKVSENIRFFSSEVQNNL